ncbi:MAG: hypothetical protein ABI398_01320 [Devosia sp.]
MTTLAQGGFMQRARRWLTVHHLAQLALIVQPLIVFRTGGEYLRLKWAGSDAIPALIDPLFISVSAIGAAAIVSLLLYFNGRERSVLALTVTGIAALIAYKLTAMPSLG